MKESNLVDSLSHTLSYPQWIRVGMDRKSGVLVPLFSVYSKHSVGIGDLNDLYLLVDWCAKTHNRILQLLPMNEVGSTFCPYDALSSFALEPLYLSLELMPEAKDKAVKDKIKALKKVFPAGQPHVDYQIKKEKLLLLREIFDQSFGSPRELKKFEESNAYWLHDFAMFKVLKEHHGQMAWYEWDEAYRTRDPLALEAFVKAHKKDITFQSWLQWQLFEQFASVKAYAQTKKVLIKGDLPILVSRDSSDVWAHPEYFKMDFVAGAPPDMYCAKGQRWGTPTYQWERIAADGYGYLKEKLRYAGCFYDILRVDHVVGLFRIWSIAYHEPMENKGLNGVFDPREEHLWKSNGETILSVMVQNTHMLLCAEDLGVIPPACPQTLQHLGILGNDVQRWVKDWNTRHDFLNPDEFRELAVTMLSTHDTTNWAAWWEYEAGTVDEGLFMRKCAERGINFEAVKGALFDLPRSKHGRLLWQVKIVSLDTLAIVLGRKKEEIMDFIDLYENSFQEKERLWQQLGIKGPVREKCDAQIVKAVFAYILRSRALVCINMLIDWLYLTDAFTEDSHFYRTNTPGTTSDNNWSLTLPISLDELMKHKVNTEIKQMITDAGRSCP